MEKAPLIFTYYIAAPVEKVWDGFVSKEANQQIFVGADFEVELRPGGTMTWSGPAQGWHADAVCDGRSAAGGTTKAARVEVGHEPWGSHVESEAGTDTPEIEAVKVVVTNEAGRKTTQPMLRMRMAGRGFFRD